MENIAKINPHFGSKLAILSCTVALLTAGLISAFYISRTNSISLQNGINHIGWQARLTVPSIKNSLLQMHNDGMIFSNMPAMRDYASYQYNEKRLALAKRTPDRLTTIITSYFEHILQVRPEYTQISLVSANNNGKELVRVRRSVTGSEIITPEHLREIGAESYFKDALLLKDGQSYYSRLTQDQKHTGADADKVAIIRNIVPIIDEKGDIFGLLIFDANYEDLIKLGLSKLYIQGALLITNQSGDYLSIEESGKQLPIQFHEKPDYKKNIVVQRILSESGKQEGSFEENIDGVSYIIYFVKIPFSDFSALTSDRFLSVALIEHKKHFVAPIKKTSEQSLILALFAICLSPLLALPFSSGLSMHFQKLLLLLIASEKAEKKALLQLQGIVENAADTIITISKKGLIQTVNPAGVKLFGYHPDELIGQNIKMLMPDRYATQHDQYLENYHNTGNAQIIGIGREVEGRRKSGEIFPIDLSVTEINSADETFYSGIIRDISARKKAENQLKASNEALLKSNAELDDFAYIASHDLKEPLRAIFNNTRFLMEDHESILPEDAKNRLNKLLDVSMRMDKLIDDLLNFSRLSREDVTREEIDMNQLVLDAIDNLAPYIEERNGTVSIEGKIPPAECDRVRVLSIIQNLIVNALKYNDRTEKIIKIGFIPIYAHHGIIEKDVYFVQDNGIGIDSKFKDVVFRIFKRLHNPKTYGQGTGSGLTFTKKNVERHGGSIWFDSVVGEGTVFYFTLKERENV